MTASRNESDLSFSTSRPAGARTCVAALLLLLQACAAPQETLPPAEPAPRTQTQPAPPPDAPALDGRFFADAGEYPWSALGRVNLAGRGFCNGVLIGAQRVLTQAQCLYTARERRWWQPAELHFIAAYQKDRFLADSKIARFVAAPGYNPAAGASLANLTNNWAVLELAEPIGLKTGWLGLQREDEGLRAAEAAGEAVFLRAGYRRDWPHAISVHIGCAPPSLGAIDLCAPTPNERALPSLVMTDRGMQVITDHFVRSASQDSVLARTAALPSSGSRLGAAEAPRSGGPVRQRPRASTALLLRALGYGSAAQDLDAAVDQYLRDQNLTGGRPSEIGVLAALIATAQTIPPR